MLRSVILGALFGAIVAIPALQAEDKPELKDAKCVVSGKAVDADKSADYEGAKVYFCCDNCPKAFAKDTKKFASKANAQLVLTKQAKQVKCPFSGKDIDESKTVKVAGVEVAFCCGNCQGKAEKAEGEKQLDMVFGESAFKKGFEVEKKK